MKIGYERISTGRQSTNSQTDALRAAGCENIWTDKGESGKKASRPEWDKCLAHLRRGDVLYVTRLDRMGRSVRHLVEVVNELAGRGVDLVVTEQGLSTTTSEGKLLFHIMAAVAEFEADIIKDRTMDGLAAARARGVKLGGRHPVLSHEDIRTARTLKAAGGYSMADIARRVGCSRATLYRYGIGEKAS